MQTSLRSSHIVVTGGNGFVGTHLLRALSSSDHSCDVLVPQGTDTSGLEDLPCVRVTPFAKPEELGPAVAQMKPEVVFHLGALVYRERTLEAFQKTLQWNLLSTLYLFEALAKSEIRRIVHIGSGEEYGHNQVPYREDAVPDPVSPYAASKAAAACYARMFYNCFGLPVVLLRPSVVYGPDQAPQFLIPEVISALLRNQTVDTTEGFQTRDFLYVADLVRAILQAAIMPGIEGEVFNIGSGETVSVRTCLEQIERLTGRPGLVRYGARPYGKNEIDLYSVDIRRAKERLNWEPHTTLRDGLGLTIAAFAGRLG